jgi:hypothetical protein
MQCQRSGTTLSMKRRFAILSMAACVLVSGGVASSGCGVQQGEENIQKARQVKKQVESGQHKLEKELREGQKKVEEGQ